MTGFGVQGGGSDGGGGGGDDSCSGFRGGGGSIWMRGQIRVKHRAGRGGRKQMSTTAIKIKSLEGDAICS